MTNSLLINSLVAGILLPPLNGLLLIIGGLWLGQRRPSLARAIIGVGIVMLWLLATPAVSNLMLATLEGEPVSDRDIEQAQAIVVLGGGRNLKAPEYGSDTVESTALSGLRYAAILQRKSLLPILVTGGKPDGGDVSEAELMRKVLVDELRVPVRWIEGEANNTWENAHLSATLLQREGIQRVLLVTRASHMARAMKSFAEAGLIAFPAPVEFHRERLTILGFIPSSYDESRNAIHEWLGLLWYDLRAMNARRN